MTKSLVVANHLKTYTMSYVNRDGPGWYEHARSLKGSVLTTKDLVMTKDSTKIHCFLVAQRRFLRSSATTNIWRL